MKKRMKWLVAGLAVAVVMTAGILYFEEIDQATYSAIPVYVKVFELSHADGVETECSIDTWEWKIVCISN